jgi:haloalkane dehalogenase
MNDTSTHQPADRPSTHTSTAAPPHTSPRPSLDEETVTAAFHRGPDRLLDVGHSQLAYWRFGRGPDVVLIHGWPLHGATFRRIIPLLAADYTLHVIDLPGTGQTQWGARTPIDIASHAATIRRAIDLMGLERYVLLAHDSGAAMARLVAAGNTKVAGLVMGNTEIPGHHSRVVELICAAARLPGGAAAFIALMRSRTIRLSALGFRGCFTDPRYVEGEFGDLFVRPLFASSRAAEGQFELARHLDFDLIDRLRDEHSRIEAPVLMIWGPRDPFFPIEKARAMVGQFPGGAELVEIPSGKLFVHEDHPEEFATHTRRLLGRVLP